MGVCKRNHFLEWWILYDSTHTKVAVLTVFAAFSAVAFALRMMAMSSSGLQA
jgi:hypothetical protein